MKKQKQKNIFVNGPVNVVRLEGEIDSVKKVIYLFMDWHVEVIEQTQCADPFSSDVQKYFADNFYKLNSKKKTYDFFLEIHPTELLDKRLLRNYKEIYIWELAKLFQRVFAYNPKTNKVSKSKIFKNVRFHYADIRDYFKLHIMDKFSEALDIARHSMSQIYINERDLESIIDLLSEANQQLHDITSVLTDSINKKTSNKNRVIKIKRKHVFDKSSAKYLISKITFDYHNLYVKDFLNNYLQEINYKLLKLIKEIDLALDMCEKYSVEVSKSFGKLTRNEKNPYLYSYGLSGFAYRDIIKDISDATESLNDKFIDHFTGIMDVYFMRRFLDKKYITNAIVYTGAAHSTVYINMLVKHFGFKITHLSYTKIDDLNKLMFEVKKREPKETEDLFNPPIISQCSDMTHFPKDFE